MINLKMKVGGYLTSVKNEDTGEELITEPTHNLVTNSGLDLLLNGQNPTLGTTSINNYFMFSGNGENGFGYPRFSLGSGSDPTTMDMTGLKNQNGYYYDLISAGTATDIVDDQWHQRIVKTVSISNVPVREIAFGPNVSGNTNIFSRVVLKNPITTAGTYTFTYDFYISLPYVNRTVVENLAGTGLPGEIQLDTGTYYGYGGVTIPKIAPGYSSSSSNTDGWVGPTNTNNNPFLGFLVPYTFRPSWNIHNPGFSSDTTRDFGSDTPANIGYPSSGNCICTPGSYVSGQGYRDFTYTTDASFPSATSGVLPIAYINLRGLQMRFGSYVDGSWVGKTVNKQATEKLNITLRYTYVAE